MTWSIIARDDSGAFGVAVASRFFAVGVLSPHARSQTGALATQALVNPLYAARALDDLAKAIDPALVVARLISEDEGQSHRQLHMIDKAGRIAAHTGSACIDWCGHTSGPGFSVAGNMLAGPEVIAQTARAYSQNSALPFGARLLAALAAGEAAGGDKRGKQAAALLIYTSEDYPALDIRVDDHAEPIQELKRLHQKSRERFQPFTACLPSAKSPTGITDRAMIEASIERFHAGNNGVGL